MAATSAADEFPPWDRRHQAGEEEELVDLSVYRELLTSSLVQLKELLHLDDLWAHLSTLSVLRHNDEERIKHNAARCDVVERLVAHIKTCETWRYHALMRAMALTGQGHLIPEGGLDRQVYMQGIPEVTWSVSVHGDGHQVSLSSDLLRAISAQCQACTKHLMKSHVFSFDNDPHGEVIDTSQCHVTVQAYLNGGSQVKLQISAEDILGSLPDREAPRTVRISGQPGDGKSIFMKYIAHSASVAFMNSQNHNYTPGSPGSQPWNTAVFIPAKDIRGSIEQTIRAHLWCREEDVDMLMEHIRTGAGVVLLFDGVDELKDEKTLKLLQEYVHHRHKRGGPAVVVSARTHLCPIDAGDFDRMLVLGGFTSDQGVEYVKQYVSLHQPSKGALYEQILGFVERHKDKLHSVLSNPLRLHIFCTLAVRGKLDLDDQGEFNVPKLFGPLEKYVLARDGASEVTKEQSQNFYRLCMFGLMNKMSEFPEKMLTSFGIVENYYAFLEKSVRRDDNGLLTSYFSFSHEMIYEYFASRYIQNLENKKSLIVSLSSNRQFRNIQEIVFQLLLQDGQMKLIETMIRGMLILQHSETKLTLCKTLYDLMQLPKKIPGANSLSNMKDVTDVCKKIDDAFDKHADRLRDAGWLVDLEADCFGTVDHVLKCLQTCSPQQQKDLASRTILRLLPCEFKRSDIGSGVAYPVGDLQWAKVRRDIGEIDISSCSPAGCLDALRQDLDRHSKSSNKKLQRLIMSLNTPSKPWRAPTWQAPEGVWTEGAWMELLRELINQWPSLVEVSIHLDETSPLSPLLSCLLHLKQELGKCKKISIEHGMGDLPELLTMVKGCAAAAAGGEGGELSLRLQSPYIVVPGSEDVEEAQRLRDELMAVRGANRDSMLTSPYWCTEARARYKWADSLSPLALVQSSLQRCALNLFQH